MGIEADGRDLMLVLQRGKHRANHALDSGPGAGVAGVRRIKQEHGGEDRGRLLLCATKTIRGVVASQNLDTARAAASVVLCR